MALVLTILATSDFTYQHTVTAWAAIALTVITGTNYTLEPGERYRAYAEAGVQLHDCMFELDGRLMQLIADGSQLGAVIDYLEKVNEQISAIGRTMADLPVPRARAG